MYQHVRVVQHKPVAVVASLHMERFHAPAAHLILHLAAQRLHVGGGSTCRQHHVVADIGLVLHIDDAYVTRLLAVQKMGNGIGKRAGIRTCQRLRAFLCPGLHIRVHIHVISILHIHSFLSFRFLFSQRFPWQCRAMHGQSPGGIRSATMRGTAPVSFTARSARRAVHCGRGKCPD